MKVTAVKHDHHDPYSPQKTWQIYTVHIESSWRTADPLMLVQMENYSFKHCGPQFHWNCRPCVVVVGNRKVWKQSPQQHSLCVPSFQEVRGFQGIHERPTDQKSEECHCVSPWKSTSSWSHLRARDSSVSGFARSSIVTLQVNEKM